MSRAPPGREEGGHVRRWSADHTGEPKDARRVETDEWGTSEWVEWFVGKQDMGKARRRIELSWWAGTV